MTSTAPDLSIIIVNWNTDDLLRECVESIITTAGDLRREVIVVDNASRDDSAECIRDVPAVRLMINSENRGFAAGNNQGIEIATGRYVLLLNPDTRLLPNALNRMVSFMDNNPDVGVLGPRLLNTDGSLQPSCSYFPSATGVLVESLGLNRLFPRQRAFAKWSMSDWPHDTIRDVDQPAGACFLLRRAALDDVGRLDERFFMYLEEVDLCFRLKRAGWRIVFLPDASVIHHGGQSSLRNLDVRIVERYKSLLRYFAKHFPVSYVALVRVLLALQMGLRLASLPLLARRTSVGQARDVRATVLARYYAQVMRAALMASYD